MIEIYRDGAGEWRWRIKGVNGEIMEQGEGHTQRADALRAVRRVCEIAQSWDLDALPIRNA